MNQNQLYPFERNRYYSGKMLTSADFQAEQDYFNNKERFLNSLMYGSGIICGLGVYSLDDLSILVESGVAIDANGREIVVDTSVVRKLSTLEGFDGLTSENVAVCLQFEEEQVHSVYAATSGENGQKSEFSRVSEGYRIFLMDYENLPEETELDSEFLSLGTIYKDEDFKAELVIPAIVSKGKMVCAKVRITKLSDADKKIVVHAVMQIPGFTYQDKQELEVDFEDITLDQGETYEQNYWLTVRKSAGEDTTFLIKSGSGYVYIDDEARKINTNFSVKIVLTNTTPRELVNRGTGALSLEMRNMADKPEYIVLSKIKLMRTANSYVIEEIEEDGVKKYLSLPGRDVQRAEYLEYFMPTELGKVVSSKKASARPVAEPKATAPMPEIATGVLEIPLGSNPRTGDIFYSGEIMHGLGKGNVYVQVGFESVSADESLGANAKSTVYGDASLFTSSAAKLPNVENAVKVLNDKGSFVVAAKLKENLNFLLLTYRWVAIKFPASDDMEIIEDYAGKSIVPETPTVILGTRESHYFGVRFQNMDQCSITYSLTEENSGEITSDGIYTAPAKEGVYEICIYCTDLPVICAYAYAIVKNQESGSNSAANLESGLGIKIAGITSDKEDK